MTRLSGIRGACLALFFPSVMYGQKAIPVLTGSNYILTTGGAALQVGPGNSARISSLKYQGAEMLYLNSSGGNVLWGSTAWASPQAYWTAACKSANTVDCWPPPAAMDGNAYTGGLAAADTAVTYTGTADSYMKLRIRKTFSANLKDSSFTNRYHYVNTSSAPITWAPWEDTRFPSGGLIFWPTGSGSPTGNTGLLKQVRDTLGITWFTYDSSAALSGTTKIFADGGAPGWMAHVDKGRVLFIKKYADTPPAKKAPGTENECELYITSALEEMELQGAYDPIPANDSIAWEVKWFVRKLPDGVAISRNRALADFVDQVVSGAATGVRAREGSDGTGGREEFQSRISRESIRLRTSRSRELKIALADVSGKTSVVLAEGRFDTGWHTFQMPEARPTGPAWLIVSAGEGGKVLYRKTLAGF
ncbi:MAG: DUF4380 domain-containing protein [Fibrobacteria bacterium]